MFRVGAFVLIALVLSLFFGCSEKTSEAQLTGLELGFMNCITFDAKVFIDDNYVGPFSSERASFIGVLAGPHTLKVKANLVVVAGDSTFCWTENFTVADGQTTYLDLDCDLGGCAP
ncbi:MAG: hypothetical protein WC674_05515 [Candidatus Krumholzibacteriia bacterium]